jgi:hypothetical protein
MFGKKYKTWSFLLGIYTYPPIKFPPKNKDIILKTLLCSASANKIAMNRATQGGGHYKVSSIGGKAFSIHQYSLS